MNKQSKNWVDYKEIKAKVSMEMVLKHYGLMESLKASGSSLVGCCPIHQGSNARQFSVNTKKNIFNCFGDCGGGGNVIDFVAKMEKVDLRKAALLIKNWFLSAFTVDSEHQDNSNAEAQPSSQETDTKLAREEKEQGNNEPVNPPLKFLLKKLDTKHPYFKGKGIEPGTIEHFGLGYCSKGLMAGRIVIPIHNLAGELVAYCGRGITPEQIEEEKYKMPPNFIKSAVVYNLNRQKQGIKILILVESFLSVYKLYQAGFNQTVALMGSTLTEAQEVLIKDFLGPLGWVLLLFDDDESGQRCTEDCLLRLPKHLFVKALNIEPLALKPHHASIEALKTLLAPYF